MTETKETLLTLDLPGVPKVKSGKVREVFDLGESLLFVATDRISAFDCVMPNGIPNKGEVLTQISHFWFDRFEWIVPNHRLSFPGDALPERVGPGRGDLARRSMVVKKAVPLPIECVARGYLSGSGWKEYRKSQTVCGVALPAGLEESAELPEPIFTPATKAETGHDENIPFSRAAELVGKAVAERVRELTLKIYAAARAHARERGIIIADTKFEFGLDAAGTLYLIDEALTPDSSRFWPADQYQPGSNPPSFDKQYVRDWLESVGWNKKPPAPELPADVTARTTEKYREALKQLTS